MSRVNICEFLCIYYINNFRKIRIMLKKIQYHVKNKFPELDSIIIKGFLFLRFICPAIVTPENFGLLEGNIKIIF